MGVGIGAMQPGRLARALHRSGALAERVFTPGELAYAARRASGAESLAARFAAKVAARSALGAVGLGLRDVEIVREPGGPPRVLLHGRAERAARRLGVVRSTLSLTHDGRMSLAQVIFEGGA